MHLSTAKTKTHQWLHSVGKWIYNEVVELTILQFYTQKAHCCQYTENGVFFFYLSVTDPEVFGVAILQTSDISCWCVSFMWPQIYTSRRD